MRVAAEKLPRTRAALLGRQDTGFTRSAVGIAGIDQHHANTMLIARQMALSDDQGRSNHFVAGEHSRGYGRPVGHGASEIRIPAGFQTGAYGGEGEAARHLIIAKQGSGGRGNHVAFTLSRESKS
jgi:hypothetical protein